jgi:hypothetical protein
MSRLPHLERLLVATVTLALALTWAGNPAALTEKSFVEKTREHLALTAHDETLRWAAVDPTGTYMLQRNRSNREPEYTVVRGTRVRPPALRGRTVGYRVRGAVTAMWSREVTIYYPVHALLGADFDRPFRRSADARGVRRKAQKGVRPRGRRRCRSRTPSKKNCMKTDECRQ